VDADVSAALRRGESAVRVEFVRGWLKSRAVQFRASILRHLQQFGELLSRELLPPPDHSVRDVGRNSFLSEADLEVDSSVRVDATCERWLLVRVAIGQLDLVLRVQSGGLDRDGPEQIDVLLFGVLFGVFERPAVGTLQRLQRLLDGVFLDGSCGDEVVVVCSGQIEFTGWRGSESLQAWTCLWF